MSPTPPSTTSSSAGAQSPEFRVVRKRNRVPLSCAPCRHRKLKCNRSMPCENCVKRGDATSCTYAQANSRKRTAPTHSSNGSPDEMQNRIDRLEGLVLSLMTNGSQAPGPRAAAAAVLGHAVSQSPEHHGEEDADHMEDDEEDGDAMGTSDTEDMTKSLGVMKMGAGYRYYVSEAHWFSIMNEITELKQHFAAHSKEYNEVMKKFADEHRHRSGAAFFFATTKPPTRSEVLQAIPSKYVADVLVTRYFNTFDGPNHVLHAPQFRRQYEEHWKAPNETSLNWIAQLFAMFRLAMISYHQNEDEPPEFRGKSLDFASTYRHVMSQCLSLTDFTQPDPDSCIVETLMLHLTAEYTLCKETDVSIWVLVGIIVRLAMRMGYHRDSSQYPSMTPFQCEIRRRIWTLVCSADAMFSFEVSLPTMIREGDSDTEFPRNINDDELAEDVVVLPPSRPKDEVTSVSYLIAKATLCQGLRKVIEFSSSVRRHNFETVLCIDKELREARDQLPEHLKLKSMNESVFDRAEVIRARFNLVSVYHKAQCVLHRQHLAASRMNARYMNSRRTCIESSLELLRFQTILHEETKAGGRLRTNVWYRNPVTKHDFMLAATLLSIDLYYGKHCPGICCDDTYTFGRDMTKEMTRALEKSLQIWFELRDKMLDAWKATSVIQFMLDRIAEPYKGYDPRSINPNAPFETHDEKRNAAMTLGLLSRTPHHPSQSGHYIDAHGLDFSAAAAAAGAGMNAPSPFPFAAIPANTTTSANTNSNGSTSSNAASPFHVFSPPADTSNPIPVDWEAWDAYIQNPGPTTMDTSAATLWPIFPESSLVNGLSYNGIPFHMGAGNFSPQGNNGGVTGLGKMENLMAPVPNGTGLTPPPMQVQQQHSPQQQPQDGTVQTQTGGKRKHASSAMGGIGIYPG